MLKKKCRLCGGSLVNNRCIVCGLDNSVYDKSENRAASRQTLHRQDISAQKTAAQSSPSAAPAAHAAPSGPARKAGSSGYTAGSTGSRQTRSTAAAAPSAGRHYTGSKTASYRSSDQKALSKFKSRITWIFVIAVIFIAVVPVLADNEISLFSDLFSQNTDDSYDDSYNDLYTSDYTYDPYSHVTREIPAEGETCEVLLGNGIYKVGVHIPEGIYHAELAEGSGPLQIRDTENSIYHSVYLGTDEDYDEVTESDDIRLYNGAELEVDSSVIVRLSTDNAQPLTEEPSANPLTDPVTVEEGTCTAGDGEIPEGIYDISAIDYTDGNSGYASIALVYPDGTSAYLWTDCASLAVTADGYTAAAVRNVVIPDGTEISVEYGDVVFTPSEGYYNVDFAGYGRQY